ncbi:hypothetical protein [[Phormidium] sp. ETS-05]|uniref:hypothetical protein n=1 Tax=[Phormidium] sp. ETS-05 TaxID=222819 RepID=UPI0018EED9FA|nr:hypothetical protein [[Phormidium] sp. ETS-05]
MFLAPQSLHKRRWLHLLNWAAADTTPAPMTIADAACQLPPVGKPDEQAALVSWFRPSFSRSVAIGVIPPWFSPHHRFGRE